MHQDADLVHLDLKADNILLCTNDTSDPKSSLITLIDFGTSREY